MSYTISTNTYIYFQTLSWLFRFTLLRPQSYAQLVRGCQFVAPTLEDLQIFSCGAVSGICFWLHLHQLDVLLQHSFCRSCFVREGNNVLNVLERFPQVVMDSTEHLDLLMILYERSAFCAQRVNHLSIGMHASAALFFWQILALKFPSSSKETSIFGIGVLIVCKGPQALYLPF